MTKYTEVHEQKKKKNYTLLAILLGFVALIFFVSIIRMKAGW